MAAEALERLAAVLEHLVEVHAGDTPARAASAAALRVERDDDGGPVVALDEARGDDADDAGVPVGRGEDDCAARRQTRVGLELAQGVVEHLLLDRLAGAILLVQLFGEL